MQKNNTMGLDFSVSCATFHPTYRKIETQYKSLLNLLDTVSSNMEKQYLDDEKSGYEWAEKNAQEKSGGENILYQNIYGQNCAAVDGHLSDLYDIQNMFYQSMLSTAYSYYESILTLIVVEKNLGNKQKPFDALKDIFLNPSERIFIAALISLSRTSPQEGQVHSLKSRFLVLI